MNKELKRMSRKDLLEILVNQSKKIDELTKELDETKEKLEDKKIVISESGSLAEASLRLNKIFEDADNAAKQYLDNIASLNEKLEKELESKAEKKTTKRATKKATAKKTTTKKTTRKTKK